jgi:hypothetical protein
MTSAEVCGDRLFQSGKRTMDGTQQRLPNRNRMRSLSLQGSSLCKRRKNISIRHSLGLTGVSLPVRIGLREEVHGTSLVEMEFDLKLQYGSVAWILDCTNHCAVGRSSGLTLFLAASFCILLTCKRRCHYKPLMSSGHTAYVPT